MTEPSETFETERTQFEIPVWNLPTVERKFRTLARRAERVGQPAPTFTIERTETRERGAERDAAGFERPKFVYEVAIITLHGVTPHFDGWTLLAIIDRDLAEPDAPNVVATLTDEHDPAWHSIGDTCDHCAERNLRGPRGRRKIAVVRHDDGTVKHVGTKCLADFLGGSTPEQIAGYAEYLAGLAAGLADDEDDRDYGAHAERRFDLDSVLVYATAISRVHGFVPKSYEGYHTADRVADAIDGRSKDRARALEGVTITDADRAFAAAVTEWLRTLEVGTNDYLSNLAAVAAKSTIRVRDLGLAVSGVNAYRRHVEGEITRRVERETAADSVHVGTVGERDVFAGTVTFTRDFDSQYGVTTLVKVLTDDGNVLVWWASGDSPEQGAKISGKARVKAHDEHDGIAQTVLTRWTWKYDLPADGSCPRTDDGRHVFVHPYHALNIVKADGTAACVVCGNVVPFDNRCDDGEPHDFITDEQRGWTVCTKCRAHSDQSPAEITERSAAKPQPERPAKRKATTETVTDDERKARRSEAARKANATRKARAAAAVSA